MSIKLAVFASGRGSNLEAILKAIQEKKLSASVCAVVSNEPAAQALNIAKKYGIKALAIPQETLSRQEHEEKILASLSSLSVDYLVLAGYMRIISPYLLDKFRDKRGYNRVINIHPSLLPAFPGARGYEDAFAYGVKVSGVTIHFVDEKVDHGPILAQAPFWRLPEDSLDAFKARGLAIEHKLYPSVLQEIAQDKIIFHSRTGVTA